MANETDAVVVRLLREVQTVQEFQDKILESISGSLARSERRAQELDNALNGMRAGEQP